MRRPRGTRIGRLRLPVLAVACLAVTSAPAVARVIAFSAADGAADPSFVTLGAKTNVTRTIPDGAHGAYLVGRIAVDGGQRPVVHLRADGTVDPAFAPRVRGGQVLAVALHGGDLAIAGTFTSVGGQARAGVAVLDARSGRPRAWTPAVPRRVPSRTWGFLAFAGATLVLSAGHHVYGWRGGEAQPAWDDLLDYGVPAVLVTWRGAVIALALDPATHGPVLMKLDPATGHPHVYPGDYEHVDGLAVVGGRLVVIGRDTIAVPFDAAATRRVALCGRRADGLVYVTSVTGDARTLYAGAAPISLDAPGSVAGVTACPFAGGSTTFRPPAIRYTPQGPLVAALALVGSDVLVFTQGGG